MVLPSPNVALAPEQHVVKSLCCPSLPKQHPLRNLQLCRGKSGQMLTQAFHSWSEKTKGRGKVPENAKNGVKMQLKKVVQTNFYPLISSPLFCAENDHLAVWLRLPHLAAQLQVRQESGRLHQRLGQSLLPRYGICTD